MAQGRLPSTWLFAFIITALLSPVVLRAQCLNTPNAKVKTGGTLNNGELTLSWSMSGSMSNDLVQAIVQAFGEWSTGQTSWIRFNEVGSCSGADICVMMGTQQDVMNFSGDMCAGVSTVSGTIMLAEGVDTAAQSSTQAYYAVRSLVAHEIGHILMLSERGYQASDTVMTNYDDNNYNDCEDAVLDAGYPGTGMLYTNDKATAKGCVGSREESGGGGEGEVHSGGGCTLWGGYYILYYAPVGDFWELVDVEFVPTYPIGPCEI